MRLFRLLVGLCVGLAGVAILIGSLLLLFSWLIVEKDKDWSFLIVLALGLCAGFLLILFARWCFKARKKDESPRGPSASPVSPAGTFLPPPLPVPESVVALGEVGMAIFALNSTDVPFQIVAGDGKEADLVAEWNLVDAKWRDLLMAAGVRKVFRISLKLDPAAREVRTLDREYDLTWKARVPVLGAGRAHASVTAEVFRGREHKKEYQVAFKAEDVLASLLGLLRGKWVPPKPIYEFKFETSEIKTPIFNAVTRCGWTVRQIAFGDL